MTTMTRREQVIDAAEHDPPVVIDEDIADTAYEMDNPDDSDEESVSDGWAETTSDSGSSTRDLVPVSINAALQKLRKTLKLLKKTNFHHNVFVCLCRDIGLSGNILHDMKV
jgi:hypothetical protein